MTGKTVEGIITVIVNNHRLHCLLMKTGTAMPCREATVPLSVAEAVGQSAGVLIVADHRPGSRGPRDGLDPRSKGGARLVGQGVTIVGTDRTSTCEARNG